MNATAAGQPVAVSSHPNRLCGTHAVRAFVIARAPSATRDPRQSRRTRGDPIAFGRCAHAARVLRRPRGARAPHLDCRGLVYLSFFTIASTSLTGGRFV
jgi:hypothetical protein